ncbi:MAG: C4-type zinc ribbon domain-containing protein [Gemmatimonadota bacterium]|nr:C4-type zinc ribbon domain-containing protein [Gemmatimonadota bacterium]
MEATMVTELLNLQEMDEEITLIEKELRELDAEREELVARVSGLEGAEKEATVRLEREDAHVRQAERTVNAGRATLKRLQQRAQEVHNMREHLAARTEVDAARQNLEAAETALLDAMQAQERARDELESAASGLATGRDETATRLAELDARRAELADRLAIRRDRRENRALRIDESVRSLYDRVRGGRQTRALAPILEGVCGACYTSIPLQRQAEVRSGRSLIVCEACGVILHADD